MSDFVEADLYKRSPTIILNSYYKEDLIQDTWKIIFENARNYKADKGAMTTYFIMWIKHIVEEFYCENISHTTPYYAQNIKKIDAAVNECRLKDIQPDLDQIIQMTKLSKRQITNAYLQKSCGEWVPLSEV